MSPDDATIHTTNQRPIFQSAICYMGDLLAFSGFLAVLVAYVTYLSRHANWSNGSLVMVSVSACCMLFACVGLGFVFTMALLRKKEQIPIRMRTLYVAEPHLDSLVLIATVSYALSSIGMFTIAYFFRLSSDLLAYLFAAFFAFGPVVFAVVVRNLSTLVEREKEEIGPRRSLLKNYVLIAALIAVVMSILSISASLRDFQLSLYSRDRLSWVLRDTFTNAVTLDMKTIDPSYLGACFTIVSDLQKIGVTSILVPIPKEFRLGEQEYKDLNRLQNTGIVVFGQAPIQASPYFPKWRVNHPTLHQLEVSWGVFSCESNSVTDRQYVPFEYSTSANGSKVADVALELVNKYQDRADRGEIRRVGNRILVGGYSVPILREGVTYTTHHFMNQALNMARYDDATGAIRYYAAHNYFEAPKVFLRTSQMMPISDSEIASRFSRKIVFICPSDVNEYFRSEDLIGSVLTGKLPVPYDNWNEVLVFFSILCAALICYKLPPLHSVVIIFIGVVLVFFAGLLVTRYVNVLIEPIYMMVAMCLGVATFPAVKISHKKKYLQEAERKRLTEELKSAHDMQMGLMPISDPIVQGFDISGVCRPAEEVGGDYFDYVWLNEEKTRLGIAIADVSGKAMKAAMTAVMTSGMVYRELGSNETPKTILRKINRPMYFKTDKRIFTAMSFAVIDTLTKSFAFSNAGQMQPLLKRNGQIESLKVEGARLPLGMAEDVEYNELTVSLQSGDTLVFYTDGIPEALNDKNEMFGFERLEVIVKESTGDLSAKQVAAKIVEKVAEFAGSAKQHDDMTVVVVKVL